MKVLSFDQSTTRSGWSVFQDSQYIKSGCIDLHKEKESELRFHKMYENIYSLIIEEKPDFIVFEDTQMQSSNGATYKTLCQLQGTIMGMCFALGINFKIMAPTQWRSILKYKQGKTVKREELKAQSKAYAKDYFGIEDSEDRAEAACIGAAYNILNHADDGIDID